MSRHQAEKAFDRSEPHHTHLQPCAVHAAKPHHYKTLHTLETGNVALTGADQHNFGISGDTENTLLSIVVLETISRGDAPMS